MGSHHQVCVDKNTEITHRMNCVDRGPIDEQRRPGQLVLASRRRTPQNFSFVRIELKSVRLHPTGTGAGSELGGKCIDVRGRARAIDLCVVGIQVRCQTMAFDQGNQAGSVQYEQNRTKD